MADSDKKPPLWRRFMLPALLGAGAFVLVALLTYAAGLLGTQGLLPESASWRWQPTPRPGQPPPVTPFAQLDPAVADALHQNQGVYDAGALSLPGFVPPPGAYLPQVAVPPPEAPVLAPPPTLVPLPTSPYLAQSEDVGILPTQEGQELAPATGYGGDGCAPRDLPVSGVLTQRFHAWHSGIDLGVPIGTPVLAAHSGQVIFAGWSEIGYGNLVVLQNGPFITYYAHLDGFNVEVNQLVGAGTVLAFSGNTGNSTGPHLHYETRINDVPVDPLTFAGRGYRWC